MASAVHFTRLEQSNNAVIVNGKKAVDDHFSALNDYFTAADAEASSGNENPSPDSNGH